VPPTPHARPGRDSRWACYPRPELRHRADLVRVDDEIARRRRSRSVSRVGACIPIDRRFRAVAVGNPWRAGADISSGSVRSRCLSGGASSDRVFTVLGRIKINVRSAGCRPWRGRREAGTGQLRIRSAPGHGASWAGDGPCPEGARGQRVPRRARRGVGVSAEAVLGRVRHPLRPVLNPARGRRADRRGPGSQVLRVRVRPRLRFRRRAHRIGGPAESTRRPRPLKLFAGLSLWMEPGEQPSSRLRYLASRIAREVRLGSHRADQFHR
jgi:hypothetical protein